MPANRLHISPKRTSQLVPIRVADLMPAPPSDMLIADAQARQPMFGDVPQGATIIIRAWNLHYALQYEGWAEMVWLDEALKRQRSTLRNKPLEAALEAYESQQQQAA